MARLEEWLPRAPRLRTWRVHRIRLIGLLCHLTKKCRRPYGRRHFLLCDWSGGERSGPRRNRQVRFQLATISNECVSSAVLAIMIEAEQYLSCDRLMARSTVAGLRFLPVTVKWK